MWPNPHKTVDLVTFTEEILNGKLHFLCSEFAAAHHPNTGKLMEFFRYLKVECTLIG